MCINEEMSTFCKKQQGRLDKAKSRHPAVVMLDFLENNKGLRCRNPLFVWLLDQGSNLGPAD